MIEPYINFEGKAQQAIDLYEAIFQGTNKELTKVSDMPQNPEYPFPEEMMDLIAHGQLDIKGTTLHFSDMQPDVHDNGKISLYVKTDSPEQLMEIYNKLLEGGEIRMEPMEQSYAKLFAWVKDQFGIDWQLACE